MLMLHSEESVFCASACVGTVVMVWWPTGASPNNAVEGNTLQTFFFTLCIYKSAQKSMTCGGGPLVADVCVYTVQATLCGGAKGTRKKG